MTTITGIFKDAGGHVMAMSPLRFKPVSAPLAETGGNITMGSILTTITDATGALSIALHAGDYEVYGGIGNKFQFRIAVPGTGAGTIDQYITSALTYTYSVIPSAYPVAKSDRSGSVKTTITHLDPVVYEKTEMDALLPGKATSTVSGLIKTTVNHADPVVYEKTEMDGIIATIPTLSDLSALTTAVAAAQATANSAATAAAAATETATTAATAAATAQSTADLKVSKSGDTMTGVLLTPNVYNNVSAMTFNASLVVDMSGDKVKTVAVTNNFTVSTTNRMPSGGKAREVLLVLTADGTPRNIGFASGIMVAGIIPTTIAAGKTLLVALLSTGPNEANTIAGCAGN